jgi:hypothetical protein
MSGEDLSSREPYFLTAQKCRTRYQCVYEARVLGNGLAARSVMIAGASAGAKALRGCAARPAPAACVARFRTVHVASFEEVRIDLRPVSRFSLYFSLTLFIPRAVRFQRHHFHHTRLSRSCESTPRRPREPSIAQPRHAARLEEEHESVN